MLAAPIDVETYAELCHLTGFYIQIACLGTGIFEEKFSLSRPKA